MDDLLCDCFMADFFFEAARLLMLEATLFMASAPPCLLYSVFDGNHTHCDLMYHKLLFSFVAITISIFPPKK